MFRTTQAKWCDYIHDSLAQNELMKGIVLAGGTGSRLNPLPRVTNRHLLPIYDTRLKPINYSCQEGEGGIAEAHRLVAQEKVSR
jgi:hypothetical protein